jgi:bacillithiol biosynthesis deacetylase BshB1
MNLDILAIAAHPDDVEISASGTLLKAISRGSRVGIVDLTMGQMGSRGSATLRLEEAKAASELLGLSARENLGLDDCFFQDDRRTMLKIIQAIRKYKPRILLVNAPSDRHPDHGRAAKLVSDAAYYSGLWKIETLDEQGMPMEPWRPKTLHHFVQDYYLEPSFVVDITEFWEKKLEALRCYSSQFYDPKSTEPNTPISGSEFFDFLKARAMHFGRPAGVPLAEGFISSRPLGVTDVADLF